MIWRVKLADASFNLEQNPKVKNEKFVASSNMCDRR